MKEKPELIISKKAGHPLAYSCSICGQRFVLPEGPTPRNSVSELWEEFKQHVLNEHPLISDKLEKP